MFAFMYPYVLGLFAIVALVVCIALIVPRLHLSTRSKEDGEKPERPDMLSARQKELVSLIMAQTGMRKLGLLSYAGEGYRVDVDAKTRELDVIIEADIPMATPFPIMIRKALFQNRWSLLGSTHGSDLVIPHTLLLRTLTLKSHEQALRDTALFDDYPPYEVFYLEFSERALVMRCSFGGCFIDTSLKTTEPDYELDEARFREMFDALIRDADTLTTLTFHSDRSSQQARCEELEDEAGGDWMLFAARFRDDSREDMVEKTREELEEIRQRARAGEDLSDFETQSLRQVARTMKYGYTESRETLMARLCDELFERLETAEFIELDELDTDQKVRVWLHLVETWQDNDEVKTRIVEVLEFEGYQLNYFLCQLYSHEHAHLWKEPWWVGHLEGAIKAAQLMGVEAPLDVARRGHIERFSRGRIELAPSTAEFIESTITRECLASTPYSLQLSYKVLRKIYRAHPRHPFSTEYIEALVTRSPVDHIESWLEMLPVTSEHIWLPLLLERALLEEVGYLTEARWSAFVCMKRMCEAKCAGEHLDLIDRAALFIFADDADIFAELPMRQELGVAIDGYIELSKHQGHYAGALGVLERLITQARPELRSIYETRRDALIAHAKKIGIDGALSTSALGGTAGGLSME